MSLSYPDLLYIKMSRSKNPEYVSFKSSPSEFSGPCLVKNVSCMNVSSEAPRLGGERGWTGLLELEPRSGAEISLAEALATCLLSEQCT